MCERLGLDQIKPYRYVIFDEPPPQSRLLNQDEIENEVRQLLPQIKWESIVGSESIEENIFLFNEIKLFIGVRSVSSLLVTFMQKNTIIIDIQTNPSLDVYFMASSLPRYYIVTRDNTIHSQTRMNNINISCIKKCVKIAKQYL